MQVQRVHRGCASAGTDTRINDTVAVKAKHVIDRGKKEVHSPRGIKEGSHEAKGKKEGGEWKRIVVQDVQ